MIKYIFMAAFFLIGCPTWAAGQELKKELSLSQGPEGDRVEEEYKAVPFAGTLKASGYGGSLTEEDVSLWFQHQKLIQASASTERCLEVEELTDAAGNSKRSKNAAQIFFISLKPGCFMDTPSKLILQPESSHLIFILKHYHHGRSSVEQEIKELIKLKKSFSTLGFTDSLPRLVFNEHFYKYEASDDSYRYVGLIHPAKGYCLWDYVEAYVHEEDGDRKQQYKDVLVQSTAKLGEVLANFHLKYMGPQSCPYWNWKNAGRVRRKSGPNLRSCETKTHGDLHFKNIFWDGKRISFIDISTLSNPSYPQNFIEEIGYIIGMLNKFSASLFDSEDEAQQIKRKKLLILLSKTFLDHYFSVFKKQKDEATYRQFVEHFKQGPIRWTINVLSEVGTDNVGPEVFAAATADL